MPICPNCNIKLEPGVHKFCYGCGKTVQDILSIAREKHGKYIIFLCSNIKFGDWGVVTLSELYIWKANSSSKSVTQSGGI